MHAHLGLRHQGKLFPFPPLVQQNQKDTNPPVAAVDVPQEAAMEPSEKPQETATARPEGAPSIYCLQDLEDIDLDSPEPVHIPQHHGHSCPTPCPHHP